MDKYKQPSTNFISK